MLMSGSKALAPSSLLAPLLQQRSPVSTTTGCSQQERIVDLASLRERGLRLMDRVVVRDAIVTQGSATDSGCCSQRLGELVTTQNIVSVQGIEGVDSRVTMQVGADSVRGFSEFAVAFCKDEVRAHAGTH